MQMIFLLDLESTRSLPIIWLVDISRAGIPLRSCARVQLRCTRFPLRYARNRTETHSYSREIHPYRSPTELRSYPADTAPMMIIRAQILHSYTLSSIIAVFIPDKRQNMFHELRNWRNHCLHSLLKVPISKIFFKSYIFFFVLKVRILRVSRLPLLEILLV